MSFKVGDVVIMVDDALNLKDAEGVVVEIDNDLLKIDFGINNIYYVWPRRVRNMSANIWNKLERALTDAQII